MEFPKEGSVFDHCFNLSEGVSKETNSLAISKSLQLRANIPQVSAMFKISVFLLCFSVKIIVLVFELTQFHFFSLLEVKF